MERIRKCYMTICKALKQNQDKHNIKGFYHRNHKSKKNQKVVYGYEFVKDYKRRKEKLKYENIE